METKVTHHTPGYLRTSDIAKSVGAHSNTVRLYEEWGFLPPVPRAPNSYRLFYDLQWFPGERNRVWKRGQDFGQRADA